ncbi:hypothetical protein CYMTET_31066 [Cymbomonas tetramitiformis]|uniref:RING-type domain-containing protein n=1 Tax=Cymbomonas tetramitiformis TaxID=36881 RepID=A0AAE0FJ33_9CHLO|nr:hypothetical protein CYMTET_31066 [Cymbomonas tetramitiformis]
MSQRHEVERDEDSIRKALSCNQCGEVMRECTTVVECMHTFCRACLDKFVQEGSRDNRCPKCLSPLGIDPYGTSEVRFDHQLNAIVLKIFPRDSDAQMMADREERENSQREASLMRSNSGRCVSEIGQ